ncbi:PE family protein, partial [Mycobacterium tuberculosis]|uniref:PE family protein n=1 Tax=Mycobacterium tuberculosis TaxID=1773 RepID=UPI000AE78F22
MSFVIAAPETLVRAASDLANIGSTLGAANAAALGPTTELLAAGADEVSAAIASLFAAHGQAYQAVSAQMSAFHAQFVQTFTAGAGAYASAEAAAAAPLEGLLNIVNTPTQLLLGRPLIGNGANGAPGTGQAGGAGGLLYGNGGAGGSGAPPLHTAQQQALAAVNAPIQAVTGRPLIGNGANGAPGSGAPGGHGGWLFGGGGTGGSG